MDRQTDPFVLGITMAGAVSAGAYTAGVLDFLFRALDAHNARVAEGADEPEAPRHRVALKVMSGASAGGVCAALGLAGLAGGQGPDGRLRKATEVSGRYAYSYVLAPLHDVWVTGLDLWRPDRQEGFLALSDLDAASGETQAVRSVLNSAHIEAVANDALSGIRHGAGARHSFLSDPVDVFLTTTNLMGVPYTVRFTGQGSGQDGHRMAQHGAVRHFRIDGLGAASVSSPWLEAWGDEGIRLPLPESGQPLPIADKTSPWGSFKAASIATGAFPVGLAPQLIEAEARDFVRFEPGESVRGGALPIDADPGDLAHARPDFGPDALPDTKVDFVAVDGGLVNNEPFEYARFTLRRRQEGGFLAPNPRHADTADRAVLMIDPFPEGPEYEALEPETAPVGLVASALRLFPSLKNQARFKPAELIHAADQKVHSRFIIFPTRSGEDGRDPAAGAAALASGGLGGFLGFADQSFRMHDFVLGQRNCQRFLQKHFKLDATNPVLNLPEGHPDRDSETAGRRIVDPGPELDAPIALPTWPRIEGARATAVLTQARRRIGAVGDGLLTELAPRPRLGWLLRRVWSLPRPLPSIGHHVEKATVRALMAELILRDQHGDYAGLSSEMRKALAELVLGKRKTATAEDLARASEGVSAGEVRQTLDRLAARGLVWRQRWARPGTERHYAFGHPAFRPGLWTKMKRRLS